MSTVVDRLRAPKAREERKVEQKQLVMPFPRLADADNRYTAAFLGYLSSRGFTQAREFCQQYDLRYCLTGRYRWRVIVPFYENKELVGWTARTISPTEQLRYDTLSPTDGARIDPSSYVWNRNRVADGSGVLVVVEGPLDALKLDWYMPQDDMTPAQVTCLFGKPKHGQLEFLARTARRYHKILIAMDADAYSDSVALAGQLRELSGGYDCRAVKLVGVKDPGEMTRSQVREFFQKEAFM
jgi:hypothetical protein